MINRNEYWRTYQMQKRRSMGIPESLGYSGELFTKNFFKDSDWVRGNYDFRIKGKKVDVKTSLPIKVKVKYKNKIYIGKAWKFSTKRQRGLVDYFFLICMDKDRKVLKTYFVPNASIRGNSISIGINKSYYDKFLIEGGGD